jgi:cellulose biosynthesis protein BcsQ
MNESRVLITAITESDLERSVVAIAIKQGWQVIFRARIYKELSDFLEAQDRGEVLILRSDSFALPAHAPLLHTPAFTVVEVNRSVVDSGSLHLAELVRKKREPAPERVGVLLSSRIIGVATSSSSAGGSTIALNIAQEMADQGQRALFVDGNHPRPFVARHLDLFGAHRSIVMTQYGFSTVECTTREMAKMIENHSSEFDVVVIDCGDFSDIGGKIAGQRASDICFQWATELQATLLLISTLNNRQEDSLGEKVEKLLSLRPYLKVDLLINQVPAMSRKMATQLQSERRINSPWVPILLPRDVKAVKKAEGTHSTLARVSPKSALRAAITAYCGERHYWRD